MAASMEASVGSLTEGSALVHLKVVPPVAEHRSIGDICLIIDVSGSMQQPATLQAMEAGAVDLSVLDIVRHAVKTVIHTLQATDRLGVVSYSDRAAVVLEMTAMDSAGQAKAVEALGKLVADGQTNLWDGLKTGLDLLGRNARAGAVASALLLTDGVPNIDPRHPQGHVGALRQYRQEKDGQLPAILHTFGFGYDLDSKLLDDLANEGGGLYSFIPDAGFVGTTLVNCTANALATIGRNLELTLAPTEGCEIEHVFGYPEATSTRTPSSLQVQLGCLQLGQSKDLVVQVSGPKITGKGGGTLLVAELKYAAPGGPGAARVEAVAPAGPLAAASPAVVTERARLRLVEVLHGCLSAGRTGALSLGADLATSLLRTELPEHAGEQMDALRADVAGQVREALSREDWFGRWGRHYLASLARAHLLQQCNNFKDPGVQLYGGELFKEVRDKADDIFLSLPAPSPEDRSAVDRLKAFGFEEDLIRRALEAAGNNEELAVQYCIEATRTGAEVEVLCVVETRTAQGAALLVNLPCGLSVTPWHPILHNGQWRFPRDLAMPATRPCPAVYNLVLTAGHVPCIGDTWTVSLGHGIKGEVVGHRFWGTNRVVEDLKHHPTWETGKVALGPGCVRRDEQGQVCGLRLT